MLRSSPSAGSNADAHEPSGGRSGRRRMLDWMWRHRAVLLLSSLGAVLACAIVLLLWTTYPTSNCAREQVTTDLQYLEIDWQRAIEIPSAATNWLNAESVARSRSRFEASDYRLYKLYSPSEPHQSQSREHRSEQRHSCVPVLFVHGHRGDARQFEPLISRIWNTSRKKSQQDSATIHETRFCFYTVSFGNAALPAFSASQIEQQAQFTLVSMVAINAMQSQSQSQSESEPDVNSAFPLIVVGHSMGGIAVSRAVQLMRKDQSQSNHQSDSQSIVKLMVTINTPHTRLPLFVDEAMAKLWNELHQFQDQINQNALQFKQSQTSVAQMNSTVEPLWLSLNSGPSDWLIDASLTQLPETSFTHSLSTSSVLGQSFKHDEVLYCIDSLDLIAALMQIQVNQFKSIDSLLEKKFQAQKQHQHQLALSQPHDSTLNLLSLNWRLHALAIIIASICLWQSLLVIDSIIEDRGKASLSQILHSRLQIVAAVVLVQSLLTGHSFQHWFGLGMRSAFAPSILTVSSSSLLGLCAVGVCHVLVQCLVAVLQSIRYCSSCCGRQRRSSASGDNRESHLAEVQVAPPLDDALHSPIQIQMSAPIPLLDSENRSTQSHAQQPQHQLVDSSNAASLDQSTDLTPLSERIDSAAAVATPAAAGSCCLQSFNRWTLFKCVVGLILLLRFPFWPYQITIVCCIQTLNHLMKQSAETDKPECQRALATQRQWVILYTLTLLIIKLPCMIEQASHTFVTGALVHWSDAIKVSPIILHCAWIRFGSLGLDSSPGPPCREVVSAPLRVNAGVFGALACIGLVLFVSLFVDFNLYRIVAAVQAIAFIQCLSVFLHALLRRNHPSRELPHSSV